jgi:hypothetical protein
MDRLQKTCMELFKKDDLRKHIIQPIVQYLYNELYFYIWIICLYHILFISIIIFIMYYLLKILYYVRLREI